ncbi:hypothetical protein PPERSA_07665 [Pseudocohnilembus persalinus]|uniref:Nucleic acid-binding, OB-fold n=1 Tax=Pseudocohnilembus persalinus TaxID=266149 RepID=A0A0V0QIG8_PSEPJ|nr:hypothetical protein PPERSA_07665 [Pseudocohnilembus persalinus]|eukprot:KRX02020.1 hypothetical protein PPERSA_07665 [Pseudocohnilembus persalinus]
MAWYGLQLNTDILKKQDFDMILKIVDKKSSINLGHENQIENEDEENSQSQYIKRNQEQELKVSNYTSICLIPEYFIDFSNFEYYIYELITEQNQANTIKQGIQESQQGLNEFDTENKDANFNTTTDLIDLIKIQNTYSQDQKIKYENQKYKVNCYVIDIQPQKIQDSLLYLCKNCKVTHEYQQGNEAICCGKVCQLIQEICFIVKDKSIDTDPLVFELYVYPYDSNPSELFPGINLRNLNNDQNSLEIYNFIYNNYIDELFNKSGLIQYLEFIIQPMFYKNTMIFRIVDSQIKKIDFKDN